MSFENVPIGSIADVKSGYAFKSRDWAEDGVPVIKIANVKDGSIVLDGCSFVSEEVAGEASAYRLRAGDILVSMTGYIGEVGRVRSNDHMVLNQRVGRFSLFDPDATDPDYFFFALRNPRMKAEMQAHAYGAAQPNISPKLIKELTIPLPPPLVQRRIAAILTAYDDLIENNTRRIATLEQIAQAIYMEWFVNFWFPGHENVEMIESELGPIPDGWKVQCFLDLASVQYGHPFKSKLFNDEGLGTRLIRIRDVPKNMTATFTTEEADDKYQIEDGDILVGMDGDFHMCRWAGGRSYLNQRVARFRPQANLPRYCLFLALAEPIRVLNATITGTTVAHLLHRHVKEIKIVVPPPDLIPRLQHVFDPLFDLEIKLRQKKRVLQQTLDLLLPKLVSGQIDVADLDLDTSGLAA